jgi:hypothetical protein
MGPTGVEAGAAAAAVVVSEAEDVVLDPSEVELPDPVEAWDALVLTASRL